MGAHRAVLLSVIALAAGITLPAADANHCENGITIYGRGTLPGAVPPPSPAGRLCLTRNANTTPLPTHNLPPGTNAVHVRVEADIGAAYPVLLLRMYGMGWNGQVYVLWRTASATGATAYAVDGWVNIPDAQHPDPRIRAVVTFPGGVESYTEYTVLRTTQTSQTPLS